MIQHKYNIRTGALFPWYFRVIGVILIFTSIIIFIENPALSLFLFILGTFIVISFSGFQIDFKNNTYLAYYSWFHLFKSGKQKNYDGVEKLYINANNVSRKYYTAHTMQSSSFKNVEYDAYIKFDNGEKEYLCSNKKLDKLKHKISPLAEALNIIITDNT